LSLLTSKVLVSPAVHADPSNIAEMIKSVQHHAHSSRVLSIFVLWAYHWKLNDFRQVLISTGNLNMHSLRMVRPDPARPAETN